MEDRILPRQLCALALCAFTVPAVGLLPRAGWLWAGIAASVTAGLLAAGVALCRKKGGSLTELAAQSGCGRWCLRLLLVWNLFALGTAARYLCKVYPDSRAFPLVGALLLLLAVCAAGKGVSAVARAAAVCFFFFVALYALLFGFSLPQMRTAWLRPTLHPAWQLLPAALAPVCSLTLTGHCRTRGRISGWLLGGVGLAVLTALVTAGCVSPEVAGEEPFAFYTMSKSISLFGAMERFEAIVSAGLTAGGFCLLALMCLANAEIVKTLRQGTGKAVPAGNFLLGGAAIFLGSGIPAAVMAAGSAIFWGVLPFGILLLGNRKKY